MQILIHADMKSTKQGIHQQKKTKINPFVIKPVLESNCKRFRGNAMRENFNLKPET